MSEHLGDRRTTVTRVIMAGIALSVAFAILRGVCVADDRIGEGKKPQALHTFLNVNNGSNPKVDAKTGEKIKPIEKYGEVAERVRIRAPLRHIGVFDGKMLRAVVGMSDFYIVCETKEQNLALFVFLANSKFDSEIIYDRWDGQIKEYLSGWSVPISSLRIFYPQTGEFTSVSKFLK